jgi:hypothetical protein
VYGVNVKTSRYKSKKKLLCIGYIDSKDNMSEINIEEIKKLNDNYEKVIADNNKMRSQIAEMRSEIDKLRIQMADKTPKAVLLELEGKINTHSKALDATSKKLFEVQNNVNAFVQQPISHTLIDTIRKQLTEEILANTRSIIEFQTDKTNRLIEEKNMETRNMINNAKRFMYR